MKLPSWKKLFWLFVDNIYADHNSTPRIRKAIECCLQHLRPGEMGLNIGGGATVYRNVKCLDITRSSRTDCIGDAHLLPFRTDSFGVIISQEVFEHLHDMDRCATEAFRVLKPEGIFYCQIPFIIGFHPGPSDYWRCTEQGLRELLVRAGFQVRELQISAGPAFGFHRIATEFSAIIASAVHPRLYSAGKAAGALLFYPVKMLDGALSRLPQANRIAGGFYAIARKPAITSISSPR